MGMLGGYAGSILKVDLGTGNIDIVPLTPELAKQFIGGAGVNARLAWDYVRPGAHPLSPQNALILGAGPLVGTLAPGAGKTNITFKSVHPHFIGSSGSGHLGMIKFAGYDHVIITGKANDPVCLEIGDKVRIRPAAHLWGKDTFETTDAIWHELGRKYDVLSIGPAGERLVADASVIANKYSAFARTGIGAVMGSKNLKAVAVYGSRSVKVAHPRRFMEAANKLTRETMRLVDVPRLRKYGSLINLESRLKSGSLSYKNFRQVQKPGDRFVQMIGLEKFEQGAEHGPVSCLSCPVGCKHRLHWREGEYEGMSLLLSCAIGATRSFANCGVMSWPETIKCTEMCNRLGIDYLSTSNLVGMAIDLFQRGEINRADTGGYDLEWNAATVFKLLRAIAYREDLGDALAEGLIEGPRRIGRSAVESVIQYKGLGTPVDMRRSLFPFSTPFFSMITNVIGRPCHSSPTSWSATKEKLEMYCLRSGMKQEDIKRIIYDTGGYDGPRLTRWTEDYCFALECLGLCYRTYVFSYAIDDCAELYSAATGIDMSGAELLEAAARGWDMRKAFNLREGATRRDDAVPERLLMEPLQVGDTTCPPLSMEDIDIMISAYYQERGWDSHEGTLTPERILELGLSLEEFQRLPGRAIR